MNKDIRKWICVFFALVFLTSSTSMSIQSTFHSDVILTNLSIISVASSFLTLVFALSSLPRWQSFFGLMIFIYSMTWFATAEVGIH